MEHGRSDQCQGENSTEIIKVLVENHANLSIPATEVESVMYRFACCFLEQKQTKDFNLKTHFAFSCIGYAQFDFSGIELILLHLKRFFGFSKTELLCRRSHFLNKSDPILSSACRGIGGLREHPNRSGAGCRTGIDRKMAHFLRESNLMQIYGMDFYRYFYVIFRDLPET